MAIIPGACVANVCSSVHCFVMDDLLYHINVVSRKDVFTISVLCFGKVWLSHQFCV